MAEWLTPEELAESLFGHDWRIHPDYLAGREWVRKTFYNGGEMPSDQQEPQVMNNNEFQAIALSHGYDDLTKTQFYEIANSQGQKRLPRDTFTELFERVMGTHKAREKNQHVTEWRKNSGDKA